MFSIGYFEKGAADDAAVLDKIGGKPVGKG
jgi:hypothetical protein